MWLSVITANVVIERIVERLGALLRNGVSVVQRASPLFGLEANEADRLRDLGVLKPLVVIGEPSFLMDGSHTHMPHCSHSKVFWRYLPCSHMPTIKSQTIKGFAQLMHCHICSNPMRAPASFGTQYGCAADDSAPEDAAQLP